MPEGVLATAECEKGHTWDVWGTKTVERWPGEYFVSSKIVPVELQSQICPDCEGLAVSIREREDLS